MTGWLNVDGTSQGRELVERMNRVGESPAWLEATRGRLSALGLVAGQRVLDIGCATGHATELMAELVGDRGLAVGLDSSRAMLAEVATRLGAAARAAYILGNAYHMPFSDGSLDACRIERLLMHLREPRRALEEAARVLRAGGRLLVVEPDFGAFLVDAPATSVTRAVLRAHEQGVRNPWIGRTLSRRLEEVGLTVVSIAVAAAWPTDSSWSQAEPRLRFAVGRARELGLVAEKEGETWLAARAEDAAAGRFFSWMPMFSAIASKPQRGGR